MTERRSSEADALEELWAGDFGDGWVKRNGRAFDARAAFWADLVGRYPAERVLEVGAAHGENLRHLSNLIEPHHLWGLDINRSSLDAMPKVAPGINPCWGQARSLPFRDGFFDLVFTVGLLIHQPDSTLPIVMSEIVRCSRRFVLCGEYHADERTDVHYRDQDGVLIKRDYGGLYLELFPELELREEGFLTMEEHGFDRVTYQLFERT
ncbi:MAG: pseudaminic acid biosynthesis-associated methylase [Microthrixaceae bacterium]